MRDNARMKEQRFPEPTTDDQPALDALVSIDPADAPDIAEGIAASLQRELDQTGISPGAEDTS
jgi:hypothetical protein